MVVDDIVVVGAKPLFMTDYIACGKVVPERIAAIVTGIAPRLRRDRHRARRRRDAEHPGLMGPTTTTSPAPRSASSRPTACSAPSACATATRSSRSRRAACTPTASRSCGTSCRTRRLGLHGCRGRPRHHVGRGAARADAALHRARSCAARATSARRHRALALARHRRRHRREPRARAAARLVGRARPVDLVARTRVPRAQRPRRHDPRVHRGHLEPRHRLLRRRRSGCRRRRHRRARRARAPPWQAGTSRSATATSPGSSRAPRASTAAPCASSAPTRTDRMRAAVSIGLPGTTDARDPRALAPRIERLGFRALWLNDVPGGDSLAGLRVVAEATETLGLATGVIPLDRRPVDTLDLDGLPRPHHDRHRLGRSAASARASSPTASTLRARTEARIVVGALGPRMRRLAAERADGVLLNWLTPTAAARRATDDLRRDAGERAPVRRGVLYVRTIATAPLRRRSSSEADRYGSVPSYAANFARLGIRPVDATIDGVDARRVRRRRRGRAARDHADGTLDELEQFAEEAARWRGRRDATQGRSISSGAAAPTVGCEALHDLRASTRSSPGPTPRASGSPRSRSPSTTSRPAGARRRSSICSRCTAADGRRGTSPGCSQRPPAPSLPGAIIVAFSGWPLGKGLAVGAVLNLGAHPRRDRVLARLRPADPVGARRRARGAHPLRLGFAHPAPGAAI